MVSSCTSHTRLVHYIIIQVCSICAHECQNIGEYSNYSQSLANNSWFIHFTYKKKKEKKSSPLSSEGGSLQTSPTSEHVVPILLRLSCLSACETKDDIMSYLICSKPLVVYFMKSMSYQNSKTIHTVYFQNDKMAENLSHKTKWFTNHV